MAESFDYPLIPAKVNFNKTFQDWDGFGINYVETAQTPDYAADPQDYGGFRTLSDDKRQEIIDLIFGADGLKPGVFKMFIDCFQQDEEHLNGPALGDIDLKNYDHETTTSWMRYFIREGLKKTRARGDDLQGVATLYGPPAFMTKTKQVRGRDLDPKYETELAKYLVSFAKYMNECEGIPIRYLSIHNEGEDFYRWPPDGKDSNIGTGHDYNLYWPPGAVASFLPLLKKVALAAGTDYLPAPGECSGWTRFSHWGYANEIAESPEAMDAIGLITSHGFWGPGLSDPFSSTHADTGIAMIRAEKPSLHAWVTSTSWAKMDSKFTYEIHRNIYDAHVNAIIPWAAIQLAGGWVGGDPNPGCAISVPGDGTYEVRKGYYYYKHFCRFGQPGMKVASAYVSNTACAVAAFASNGTKNPNAIIAVNTATKDHTLRLQIIGGGKKYHLYTTSPDSYYEDRGVLEAEEGVICLPCPADSVSTLVQI